MAIRYDWNVVLSGWWNPAFLTPKQVPFLLFGPPKDGDNIRLRIDVPMDSPKPLRLYMEDRGIVLTSEPQRVVLGAEPPSKDSLKLAMMAGARMLEKLPETPVQAVGVNLGFRLEKDELATSFAHVDRVDDALKKAGFVPSAEGIRRECVVDWCTTTILADRAIDGNAGTVSINFQTNAQTGAPSEVTKRFAEWLTASSERVFGASDMILRDVFDIKTHKTSDDKCS